MSRPALVGLACAWATLTVLGFSGAQETGWVLAVPPWDEPLMKFFVAVAKATRLPEAERQTYLKKTVSADARTLERMISLTRKLAETPKADWPTTLYQETLQREAPPSQWIV
jgi:hypothetical protein